MNGFYQNGPACLALAIRPSLRFDGRYDLMTPSTMRTGADTLFRVLSCRLLIGRTDLIDEESFA
jgi:hypothetical protein